MGPKTSYTQMRAAVAMIGTSVWLSPCAPTSSWPNEALRYRVGQRPPMPVGLTSPAGNGGYPLLPPRIVVGTPRFVVVVKDECFVAPLEHADTTIASNTRQVAD